MQTPRKRKEVIYNIHMPAIAMITEHSTPVRYAMMPRDFSMSAHIAKMVANPVAPNISVSNILAISIP